VASYAARACSVCARRTWLFVYTEQDRPAVRQESGVGATAGARRGPGCELEVFRTVDSFTDVAHTDRCAVAIGHNDIVPYARRKNLIVNIDGNALLRPVESALGRIDRRVCELSSHILETQPEAGEIGGVDDTTKKLNLISLGLQS
jgi:hypothetical protein